MQIVFPNQSFCSAICLLHLKHVSLDFHRPPARYSSGSQCTGKQPEPNVHFQASKQSNTTIKHTGKHLQLSESATWTNERKKDYTFKSHKLGSWATWRAFKWMLKTKQCQDKRLTAADKTQVIRISQVWEVELFFMFHCQGSSKNQEKHCHILQKNPYWIIPLKKRNFLFC